MKPSEIFDNMQRKFSELFEHSPVTDIKHIVNAMIHQCLNKLNLVTREEFDVQAKVLAHTRARLEVLEAKIAEFETIQAHQSNNN